MKQIKRPSIGECWEWYYTAYQATGVAEAIHLACMKAIDYALEQVEAKQAPTNEVSNEYLKVQLVEALKRIEKLEIKAERQEQWNPACNMSVSELRQRINRLECRVDGWGSLREALK
jgi:predicted RNase H-like nuclease (RuvC/YqgF family)